MWEADASTMEPQIKPTRCSKLFKKETDCISAQTACTISMIQLTRVTFVKTTHCFFISQLHHVDITVQTMIVLYTFGNVIEMQSM
jgi:hypothetical protein